MATQVGVHGQGLGRDPGPTIRIHAPEVGPMARTSGSMVRTIYWDPFWDPFWGPLPSIGGNGSA